MASMYSNDYIYASSNAAHSSLGSLIYLPVEVRNQIYLEVFKGSVSTMTVAGEAARAPYRLTYTPVRDEKRNLLLVSQQIHTECKQFYRPCLKLKSGCGNWDFFSWNSASEKYTSKAAILELDSCFDFWVNTEAAETWPIPPRLECLILRIDMTEVMDECPEIGPGESWHEFLAESRAARLSGSKGQTEAEEVRDILRDDPEVSSVIRRTYPFTGTSISNMRYPLVP